MASWLIKSNLYVALCAASLAYVTYLSLGVPMKAFWPPPASVILLGSATLFIYNLDRLSPAASEDRDEHDLPDRTPSGSLQKLMWGTMLASVLPMAWCAWVMPWHLTLAMLPAALIAVGYALPLLYWRGRWRRLKEIPGIKIVLIALVWSIATVVIPAWEQQRVPWSAGVVMEACSRALFIFAITLPFDVRDMARDERAHIITLPQLLGIPGTRTLCFVLLGAFALIQTLWHGLTMQSMAWPVLATSLFTAALVSRLDETRSERYYAVYIEGTMGFYALMMLTWQVMMM